MNVLRTCKLLSRLGQSTVSYFIFLSFVMICLFLSFRCSTKDVLFFTTVSCMHVIFKSTGCQQHLIILCLIVLLANGPTGTDWQFDKVPVNEVGKFGMFFHLRYLALRLSLIYM